MKAVVLGVFMFNVLVGVLVLSLALGRVLIGDEPTVAGAATYLPLTVAIGVAGGWLVSKAGDAVYGRFDQRGELCDD